VIKFLVFCLTKPKAIRPGFITSLNAAYTVSEINALLQKTTLKNCTATKDFMGLTISGEKK
jgi:hypothetical protein